MRTPLLLLLSCCLCAALQAQGERDWWYFGDLSGGLHFVNGVPVIQHDGQFYPDEGSSAISTPAGDLLFYTNGVGVWDKNHDPMPGGANLKSNTSITHSAIIVPDPGSNYKYYIFTISVDTFNGVWNSALCYSVVDMTLNGGNGAVLPNAVTPLIFGVGEKQAVTHNATGTGYWVVTRSNMGNTYAAFELTAAGISPNPVITIIGVNIGLGNGTPNDITHVGQMKFSPLANKLGVAHQGVMNSLNSQTLLGVAEVMDFNNNTGQLSNCITFGGGQILFPYGIEFSNSGQYLYVNSQYTNFGVYQVDVTLPNPASVIASCIGVQTRQGAGALQMSSNGKIYVAIMLNGLDVIHSPDLQGPACNPQMNVVGTMNWRGLPTFVQGRYLPPSVIGSKVCAGTPAPLYGVDMLGHAAVAWSGPGGFSSQSRNDTVWNVSAAQAGAYYYTVWDSGGSVIFHDTAYVTVYPHYQDTVAVAVCAGTPYTAANGDTLWQPGTHPVTLPSLHGCDSTIVYQLSHHPAYNQNLNVSLCAGQSHTLPDGTAVSAAGTYPVTLPSVHGCDSTITTLLTLYPAYNQNLNVNICAGQSHTLPDGTAVGTMGVYPVTLQSTHGCDSTITTTLTVYPTYNQNLNISICAGQSHTLPNGTAVNATGVYPLTLQSINGCDSVITTLLTVYPVYNETLNLNICAGQSHTLPDGTSVNTTGIYPVTLQSSHGCDSLITTTLMVYPVYNQSVNVSLCGNQSHTLPDGTAVSTTGVYPVTLQSSHGCDSTITTLLAVHPAYRDSLRADICAGEEYLLPDGTLTGAAGLYPFAHLTAAGCDSLVEVRVQVYPLPEVELGGDAALCEGSPLPLSVPAGQGSYAWNTGAAANSISVSQTGTYSLSVTTPEGCTAADSMRITAVYPLPSGFLPADSSLCGSDELRVGVPGFVSYLWEDGGSLPYRVFTEAGVYTLSVRDANGCTGTDTLRISADCPIQLYIPTAFTPNGDGENDFFRAYGTNIRSFELTLYDRWGKALHRLGSLDEGWDGAGAPEGVYTYRCTATGRGGKKLEKGGTLTLLR